METSVIEEVTATVWQYGRYLSLGLNSIVLFLWAKRRVVLNEFISGYWSGKLQVDDDDDHVIECKLYCISHSGRDNTARLFYEQKRLACGTITSRGVDELVDYNDKGWFFGVNCWNPQFMRVTHFTTTVAPQPMQPSLVNQEMPKKYHWKCKIVDRYFKQKISVTITKGQCQFSGYLVKE